VLVEGANDGVVARGDQRGHVQHRVHPRPPQMMRRPRSVPLSQLKGATPTRQRWPCA
jgi:hypothetical protein